MAVRNYSNTAFPTTLTAAVTNTQTTMSVASASGLPPAPFTMLLDWGIPGSQEVVLVTGASGTTLTVTRGYNNTTGVAHAAGAVAVAGVSAIDFSEANAHVNATGAVHGLTGNIVGTTDTQTLTNKTLTSPAITTPSGLVKGDVGLGNVDNTSDATKNAAVATLINKTLTSPIINTPSVSNPTTTGLKMAILYRAGGVQIVNKSTGTTLGLDTAAYDPYGGFTAASNMYTFPVAGFWLVTSVVRFINFSAITSPSDVQTGVSVNANTNWYGNVRSIVTATNQVIAISGSDVIQVSAGDTIVLRAYFSTAASSATCNLDVSAPYYPRMTLTYLAS